MRRASQARACVLCANLLRCFCPRTRPAQKYNGIRKIMNSYSITTMSPAMQLLSFLHKPTGTWSPPGRRGLGRRTHGKVLTLQSAKPAGLRGLVVCSANGLRIQQHYTMEPRNEEIQWKFE